MFYKLRTNWNRARFYRLTRRVLDTPPIQIIDANWSIISMVGNNDVQMYILGMKSFYARIGRGKIIAIVARDMPSARRDLLKEHIRGIQFVTLEDIDTGRCQRGGTWERLVYLLNHAQSEYAIQLDCDTLAFGPDLSEIVSCVESNRAFTLNDFHNPRIRTMREYAENARNMESGGFVGIHAERLFDRYPDCDNLKYVRASSGFAGFARGGFDPAKIEEFHEIMSQMMGDGTWRKWGTEQCGSNFAVANSPDALVLPYPKYANFAPNINRTDNAFLHFMGSHRFEDDFFARKAQIVIRELEAS